MRRRETAKGASRLRVFCISCFRILSRFILSADMLEVLRAAGAGCVDLLFPPRCLTCGALADPFCDGCRAGIRPVDPATGVPPGVTAARCVGYHEDALRKAVLLLKFQRKTALSAPLGELLAAELEPILASWQPDRLIPVPIHWTRRLERGFNQSELLAGEVARRCGLRVERSLKRIRRTPPQVGLGQFERATNLLGAFAVHTLGRPIAGSRVVLVDDVLTTGATLAECAAVLRTARVAEVYAITVSRQL
jgi:ComF family protein